MIQTVLTYRRWALCGAVGLLACGVGVKRDLSKSTPNQVLMDDTCGLQDYFDEISAKAVDPPVLVHSQEIENVAKDQTMGGTSSYSVGPGLSRATLRRLLDENWKPLPPHVASAERLELNVRWAEKASSRWVVTNENWVLRADGRSYDMAFHPCLTSFLFGERLYSLRREMLALPAPPPSIVKVHTAQPDAGAPDVP
jgi:hypothetical protein